jgi:hypothetical protein
VHNCCLLNILLLKMKFSLSSLFVLATTSLLLVSAGDGGVSIVPFGRLLPSNPLLPVRYGSWHCPGQVPRHRQRLFEAPRALRQDQECQEAGSMLLQVVSRFVDMSASSLIAIRYSRAANCWKKGSKLDGFCSTPL